MIPIFYPKRMFIIFVTNQYYSVFHVCYVTYILYSNESMKSCSSQIYPTNRSNESLHSTKVSSESIRSNDSGISSSQQGKLFKITKFSECYGALSISFRLIANLHQLVSKRYSFQKVLEEKAHRPFHRNRVPTHPPTPKTHT